MKNALITAIAFILLCTSFQLSFAQNSKDQMFFTYQVEVIPAKIQEHGKALKAFADSFKAAGISSPAWHTVYQKDFKYAFLSPIENMAALENIWAEAIEKLGYEKFIKHLDAMNECRSSITSHVFTRRDDCSYRHPSITESGSYRRMNTYTFKLGTGRQAIALAQELVALYKKQDAVLAYDIYIGEFGTEDFTAIVVDFAKDAVELAQRDAALAKKLGNSTDEILTKIAKILVRSEMNVGSYAPQLSYIPAK